MGTGSKTLYASTSVESSRSSKLGHDALSVIAGVLGVSVTRRTRLKAARHWSLAFPTIDRLKFVAFLRGNAFMILPGGTPRQVNAGDVTDAG